MRRSSSHRSNYLSSVRPSVISAVVVISFLIFLHIRSLHVITTPCDLSAQTRLSPEILQDRLRRSVTFLPLKDLRYSSAALSGHTWFMSSLYDHQDGDGDVQHQRFPSPESAGRVLCMKGRDHHDGAWNYYALAWPESLPENATVLKGLTFVSYNHYDYDNIWHGLSALFPFVAWHRSDGCTAIPDRWVLYHWGELRAKMGPWLRTLMEATFDGRSPAVETFSGGGDDVADPAPVCFEEAVVARHNEGGMSRDRRTAAYDLMRCKARLHCNVSSAVRPEIGMTVFMRTGPRSFRDGPTVLDIFRRVCDAVQGCRFRVAYSSNLTFCDQVKLMGSTDVLISPHGAQLTNMFLMDRNSSVMEFFPKGWLELAGVGQYVFQWIASWSGMRHQGAWRDPHGFDTCPFPENDRRCMNTFKNSMIGHNQTYFSQWATKVLNEAKEVFEARSLISSHIDNSSVCSC